MSHLDELDDFEAELELRLKREYTAVFGLFRYCVLTQDATYLCNRLDLAQISQPNGSYGSTRSLGAEPIAQLRSTSRSFGTCGGAG